VFTLFFKWIIIVFVEKLQQNKIKNKWRTIMTQTTTVAEGESAVRQGEAELADEKNQWTGQAE
jgi:hypothetical protein